VPQTFAITLNSGLQAGAWPGNAFEGDILSFTQEGANPGPLVVSVYPGPLSSIPPGTLPSDAFLQQDTLGVATFTVDTGTVQVSIAPEASSQGQCFTLAYTTTQTYLLTVNVNTFLNVGTSQVAPPKATVRPGANLFFENGKQKSIQLDVISGEKGNLTKKLFGEDVVSLSTGDNSLSVRTDAPHKDYLLTKAPGSGARSLGPDTGTPIGIKVDTSSPGSGDVEDPPLPRP
jgi:hypothetical protein